MNKGQSQNTSFVTRTGSFATHASRTGRNLLGWEEPEAMTDQQRREVLVHKKHLIEPRIMALNEDLKETLPFKVATAKAEKRKKLREEMLVIEKGLREIKDARPMKLPDMGECIIKLMKERMTKPQWECVLKEARKRFLDAHGHEYQGQSVE